MVLPPVKLSYFDHRYWLVYAVWIYENSRSKAVIKKMLTSFLECTIIMLVVEVVHYYASKSGTLLNLRTKIVTLSSLEGLVMSNIWGHGKKNLSLYYWFSRIVIGCLFLVILVNSLLLELSRIYIRYYHGQKITIADQIMTRAIKTWSDRNPVIYACAFCPCFYLFCLVVSSTDTSRRYQNSHGHSFGHFTRWRWIVVLLLSACLWHWKIMFAGWSIRSWLP